MINFNLKLKWCAKAGSSLLLFPLDPSHTLMSSVALAHVLLRAAINHKEKIDFPRSGAR